MPSSGHSLASHTYEPSEHSTSAPEPLHTPHSSYSPTQSSTSSHTPSPSTSSQPEYTIVLQFSIIASKPAPPNPDSTKLFKHNEDGSFTSRLTKTPLPAGMTDPVNEKPNTVDELVETVNPFSAESPPSAPNRVTPSVSNWKPAIS